METLANVVDIDSLLDSTLDDLADLPEFKAFPIGFHLVDLDLELKTLDTKDGKKSGVDGKFTYVEAVELSDPTEVPPKAGDVANIFCDLGNEFGQGTFKMILAAIKPAFPEIVSNRDMITAAKKVRVAISTGLRKDKADPTRTYLQLKKIDLA